MNLGLSPRSRALRSSPFANLARRRGNKGTKNKRKSNECIVAARELAGRTRCEGRRASQKALSLSLSKTFEKRALDTTSTWRYIVARIFTRNRSYKSRVRLLTRSAPLRSWTDTRARARAPGVNCAGGFSLSLSLSCLSACLPACLRPPFLPPLPLRVHTYR